MKRGYDSLLMDEDDETFDLEAFEDQHVEDDDEDDFDDDW